MNTMMDALIEARPVNVTISHNDDLLATFSLVNYGVDMGSKQCELVFEDGSVCIPLDAPIEQEEEAGFLVSIGDIDMYLDFV